MFDYLVIGKGLIGSAAARYLSEQAASDQVTSDQITNVAVIGSTEPKDGSKHQGVFASHYDQGRITRILDQDLVWADLAAKSIAEYASLEQASKIKFHAATGCLNVGMLGEDTRSARTKQVAEAMQVSYSQYSSEEARSVMPELVFPKKRDVMLEHGGAGYINPRSLVTAQLALAEQNASILTDEVTNIDIKADHLQVETTSGTHYKSKKVLLATGAYSNFLLEEKLEFEVLPRTIVLAELDLNERQRLKDIPSIIFYEGVTSEEMPAIYSLPPIQYPDGKTYLKLGGRLADLVPLLTPSELLDWFHSEGSKREAELLQDALFTMIPSLKTLSLTARPCVVTATSHGRPYIDELIPNKLYVAAGGNGAAAKSSNEIGRLAASMLMDEKPHQDFRAIKK